jgi:hypothetical protein
MAATRGTHRRGTRPSNHPFALGPGTSQFVASFGIEDPLLLAPIFRWREPLRPDFPRFPVFVPVDGTSCGVKSLVRIPVRTIDDIDGARCRTTAPINRTPASPLRTTARARSRSPGTSAPSLAAPRFAFAPSPSPRGRCPPSSASCLPPLPLLLSHRLLPHPGAHATGDLDLLTESRGLRLPRRPVVLPRSPCLVALRRDLLRRTPSPLVPRHRAHPRAPQPALRWRRARVRITTRHHSEPRGEVAAGGLPELVDHPPSCLHGPPRRPGP